ncbi:MAG TPA: putative toxin-antitoxin system toxin component, PIN family [Acidobacteriaceae bacterium]|nr:putative toxin-antitoxin system toxin component, PIN family [Acidobacteriaceae bacterium]
MRLVVLDTNVIISAGLKPGSVPARLVMDWVLEGKVQLVTCPSIIGEYCEVAARSKFARYDFPPAWLEHLIEVSLQLPDPARWPLAVPDPKDALFLALAQTAGAWLVTGNLRHFPESGREGVTVIVPADYLGRLGEAGPTDF